VSTQHPLGPALRRLREAAGVTQMQLAVQAGVSHDTVVRLERDQGNPTLDSLRAVLAVLGGRLEITPARRRPARRPAR
jgi:transcriptional regulator with XRE-family HTH domain